MTIPDNDRETRPERPFPQAGDIITAISLKLEVLAVGPFKHSRGWGDVDLLVRPAGGRAHDGKPVRSGDIVKTPWGVCEMSAPGDKRALAAEKYRLPSK